MDSYAGFLNNLSPQVSSRLCAQSRLQPLKPGEVVSLMGEPLVAYVKRGWFKLMRFTESGDEQLLGVRRPGSFIGLETLAHPSAVAPEVVAIAPAELVVWPYELMQTLVSQEVAVTRAFLNLLAIQIEEENNLKFLNQMARVPARLARLLYLYALEEGRPTPGGLFVRIPFTQYDLALLLGVRRETINVSLTELAVAGVLHRSGREVFVSAAQMSTYLAAENALYGCPREGVLTLPPQPSLGVAVGG